MSTRSGRTPTGSLRKMPQLHHCFRCRRYRAGRMRRQKHAELLPRSMRKRQRHLRRTGFQDEHKAALEANLRLVRQVLRDLHAIRLIAALRARLPACASMAPPKPWEKGNLARPDMQFDYDRLDTRRSSTSTPARKLPPAAMASAEAAVAVIDRRAERPPRERGGALLLSALALPGVCRRRHAQSVPDKGSSKLQYLDLSRLAAGAQPDDGGRARVLRADADRRSWVVEGGMVYDAMSGASPLYFNVLSGASHRRLPHRGRHQGHQVLRRPAVSVGAFVSSEQDFLSRGASLNVQFFSEDRNRTWLLGVAGTNDRINAINGVAPNSQAQLARVPGRHHAGAVAERHRAVEPHVLHGPRLLLRSVQAARHAPDERQTWAWLTRYNHYFATYDATLQLATAARRLVRQQSNAFDITWTQPLPW